MVFLPHPMTPNAIIITAKTTKNPLQRISKTLLIILTFLKFIFHFFEPPRDNSLRRASVNLSRGDGILDKHCPQYVPLKEIGKPLPIFKGEVFEGLAFRNAIGDYLADYLMRLSEGKAFLTR